MIFDSIDRAAVSFLNQCAGQVPAIDLIVMIVATEPLSVLFIALICAYWFKPVPDEHRERLTTGLLATALSGVLSRIFQMLIQSHPRPFYDPSAHFHLTAGFSPPKEHYWWNSFPSDHSAVYFALATVCFEESRMAGVIAYAIACLSGFARVYVGYHWPSDILGGAVLGIVCVLVAQRFIHHPLVTWIVGMARRRRPMFYGIAFLACYGIATLFNDVRSVGRVLYTALRMVAQ